tara:strand:+ start:339 stop:611 length:273 start_codon:yes stop_codon:yes gene_type:complete
MENFIYTTKKESIFVSCKGLNKRKLFGINKAVHVGNQNTVIKIYNPPQDRFIDEKLNLESVKPSHFKEVLNNAEQIEFIHNQCKEIRNNY